MREDNHLTDHELLLEADGELSSSAAARVQSHLSACWSCRARKQELDSAVVSFVQAYQRTTDAQLPSADGPRALLKARIAERAGTPGRNWQTGWSPWRWSFSALLIGCVAAA